MPETAARLRYHRASPSKVRQVLRLIVGQDVNEAREILRYCERGPADPVMKLLDSAIANAEHNDNVPEDELFVARAYADEGPTLKRGRPRARGRYGRIKKRTSHITIIVARYEDDELERRRTREAATAGPTRVSRRRRVAESRRRARAEAHDHDHEDEDHDHDHDEDVDELVRADELDEEAIDEDVDEVEDDEAIDAEEEADEVALEAADDTAAEGEEEEKK
jgi:large subunit ribosomal protein L22